MASKVLMMPAATFDAGGVAAQPESALWVPRLLWQKTPVLRSISSPRSPIFFLSAPPTPPFFSPPPPRHSCYFVRLVRVVSIVIIIIIAAADQPEFHPGRFCGSFGVAKFLKQTIGLEMGRGLGWKRLAAFFTQQRRIAYPDPNVQLRADAGITGAIS